MSKLTVAQWAKTLKISRQQGYDAIKRCGIEVVDGEVDAEVATVLYNRGTRPRANGKRTDGDQAPAAVYVPASVPGYDTSRAKREAAEAEIAEMRKAEMSGKLVAKDEVEAAVFEAARALRDAMTNCSRRIAAEVLGLPSAAAVEEVIDREHRAMQESLAAGLAARLRLQGEGGGAGA